MTGALNKCVLRWVLFAISVSCVICAEADCILNAQFSVRVYDKAQTGHMPPLQRELMDSVFAGLDLLKIPENIQDSQGWTIGEELSYNAFENGNDRWIYAGKYHGSTDLRLLDPIESLVFPGYDGFDYVLYRIPEGNPLLSLIPRLLEMPPTTFIRKYTPPKCDIGARRPLVSP